MSGFKLFTNFQNKVTEAKSLYNHFFSRPQVAFTTYLKIKDSISSVFSENHLSEKEYMDCLRKLNERITPTSLAPFQKEKIISLFVDKRYGTCFALLDEELLLVCSILKKLDISLESETFSIPFYYAFLEDKIPFYKDYPLVLDSLLSLKFDFKNKSLTKKLQNARFFDQLTPTDVMLKYGILLSRWINDSGDKEKILNELSWVTNIDQIDSWVDMILETDYYGRKFLLIDPYYSFFLKLYGKTFNSKLRSELIYGLDTESILYKLIEEKYDFSNMIDFNFIMLMSKHNDMRTFVKTMIKKENPKLIRMISETLLRDKTVNFFIIYFIKFIQTYDVNHVYFLLEKVPKNTIINFNLELSEEILFRELLKNFSIKKQLEIIIKAYEDVSCLKEMLSQYKELAKNNWEYKFKHKFKDLNTLSSFISSEYRGNKNINLSLNQIKSFPELRNIHGLEIGDLRFEIPEESFALFEYGKEMGNCIFTYSKNCINKDCSLIGVYKNNKLTYNVEVKTDNSFYNEEFIGDMNMHEYPPLTLFKNFSRKRRMFHIEKKFKVPMTDLEKKQIQDILAKHKVIS